MEKRTLTRNCTHISVACSRLTADGPEVASKGTMRNCSPSGTCIEMGQRIQEGNIVMIKATGRVSQADHLGPPDGFRTLALAEVKWSKPLFDAQVPGYAIGLRYLPN